MVSLAGACAWLGVPCVGEYDGDVGAREEELSAARQAYDELSKQVEVSADDTGLRQESGALCW